MIKRIDISAVHTSLTKELHRYITKKISSLDKYIPKDARGSVHAEVIVKEVIIKSKKQCTCEVILHLPGENVAAKESTMNMFAAIDIVQEKLKVQLKKYKERHTSHRSSQKDSLVGDFIAKIRPMRRHR